MVTFKKGGPTPCIPSAWDGRAPPPDGRKAEEEREREGERAQGKEEGGKPKRTPLSVRKHKSGSTSLHDPVTPSGEHLCLPLEVRRFFIQLDSHAIEMKSESLNLFFSNLLCIQLDSNAIEMKSKSLHSF